MATSSSRALTARLRARLAHHRISESEFTVAVAGIVAASPNDMPASESLLLSRWLRDLKAAWHSSRRRLPH